MDKDLQACIDRALDTRKRLMSGEIDVKRANAESATNHQVISIHALDLRRRMFLADETAARGITGNANGKPFSMIGGTVAS
jgi:hypothetical protein